ncbi:cyclic pyranopterin monophosphate synthase subunit MoaA [Filimonas lacunae]|uniref:GTP 3',8-cyclase n=1 Tax=Filimonas lacunae TaxID=477680 RepID=A0A173MHE3_9BACT|nr:GTP 3',8-cyclase MoaA [Filimonas lacunae]BAV07033.1 molybdenum cofactor biosynthesis protein MoaA [Filimonas lacunae]SIS95999.1 cyclic pyranopterin monophosphate synthase subunit MoaA [Filimonas lacunae]
MITDSYNRVHDYLRISLTDLCNLRCSYCMPEEDYPFMPAAQLMQPAEIAEIVKIFAAEGVTKVRLTGGEPLARKDFDDILFRLQQLPVKLTLTTNATLLHRHIDQLLEAGVSSLNISLDTLQAPRFFSLTRRDRFFQTRENIQLALQKGLQTKINMVVMKGVNEAEIPDFIEWTRHSPIEVRFIEFMPFAGNHWSGTQVFSKQEILELVQQHYSITPLPVPPHSTSTPYQIPGFQGSFAIISTMSTPFCAGCNRMRLTADGKMKNCLFSKEETNLLQALREGKPLLPLIQTNILGKAEKLGGQFSGQAYKHLEGDKLVNRSMISIGG